MKLQSGIYWNNAEVLVSCPDPTLSCGKGLAGVTKPNPWAYGRVEALYPCLVIVIAELQIDECWIMYFITQAWRKHI